MLKVKGPLVLACRTSQVCWQGSELRTWSTGKYFEPSLALFPLAMVLLLPHLTQDHVSLAQSGPTLEEHEPLQNLISHRLAWLHMAASKECQLSKGTQHLLFHYPTRSNRCSLKSWVILSIQKPFKLIFIAVLHLFYVPSPESCAFGLMIAKTSAFTERGP